MFTANDMGIAVGVSVLAGGQRGRVIEINSTGNRVRVGLVADDGPVSRWFDIGEVQVTEPAGAQGAIEATMHEVADFQQQMERLEEKNADLLRQLEEAHEKLHAAEEMVARLEETDRTFGRPAPVEIKTLVQSISTEPNQDFADAELEQHLNDGWTAIHMAVTATARDVPLVPAINRVVTLQLARGDADGG